MPLRSSLELSLGSQSKSQNVKNITSEASGPPGTAPEAKGFTNKEIDRKTENFGKAKKGILIRDYHMIRNGEEKHNKKKKITIMMPVNPAVWNILLKIFGRKGEGVIYQLLAD